MPGRRSETRRRSAGRAVATAMLCGILLGTLAAATATRSQAASPQPTATTRSSVIPIGELREVVRKVESGIDPPTELDAWNAVRLTDGREIPYTPPPISPDAGESEIEAQAAALLRTLDELERAKPNVDAETARRLAREIQGTTTTSLPTRKPAKPKKLPNLAWLGPVILYGLIGLLAAAAIALIVLTVRVLRNRTRRTDDDDETESPSAAGMIGSGATARRTRTRADQLEADAAIAADAGDYTEAIRLLHHAGLLRLDAAGLVRYRKGRTNGAYVRTLRRRDREAAGILRGLSRGTEDTYFGTSTADAAMYTQARAEWDALKRRHSPDAEETAPPVIAQKPVAAAATYDGWGDA